MNDSDLIEIDIENNIVLVTSQDPEDLDPDGEPLIVQFTLEEWEDINS